MAKIIPFKDPQHTRQERQEAAATWLARLDAGASEQDLALLGAWLDEDPAHGEMLVEMATLWDQMSVLSELSDVFPLQHYARRRQRRPYWIFPGLASGLACMLLGAILLSGLWGSGETVTGHYQTVIGEQRQLRLQDGSSLLLNTNTELEVSYSDSVRNVTLVHGEALFQVAKDNTRPFRVSAAGRVVEAVGTAFTVQHESTDVLQVLVTEGEVKLFDKAEWLEESATVQAEDSSGLAEGSPGPAGQDSIALEAGQYASLSGTEREISRMAAEEISVRLSWQHGMLLFQGEPLEQVLREIARYNEVKIRASEALAQVNVEGYFRVDDIEGLLLALESNFGIEVLHIDASNIYLH